MYGISKARWGLSFALTGLGINQSVKIYNYKQDQIPVSFPKDKGCGYYIAWAGEIEKLNLTKHYYDAESYLIGGVATILAPNWGLVTATLLGLFILRQDLIKTERYRVDEKACELIGDRQKLINYLGKSSLKHVWWESLFVEFPSSNMRISHLKLTEMLKK